MRTYWLEANAGSGKTKFLLDKLDEHSLCLTYSVASATEINKRFNKMIAYTIHGFCLKLLQAYNPHFKIIDPLTKNLLLELAESKNVQDDQHVHYTHYKSQECWLDLDDLLTETLAVLTTNISAQAIEQIAGKTTLLCIDEAQDLSELQWRVVFELLQELQVDLVIASDPKQSIYGFQGASTESYTKAKALLAQNTTLQTIKLVDTHRFGSSIAKAVDSIFTTYHKTYILDDFVQLITAEDWMQAIYEQIARIFTTDISIKILIRKRNTMYNKLADILSPFKAQYEQNHFLLNYVRYLITNDKRYIKHLNTYMLPSFTGDIFEFVKQSLMNTKQTDDKLLNAIHPTWNLLDLRDYLLNYQLNAQVSIQTVHQAKGQEADYVFICDTTLNPKYDPSYDLEQYNNLLYVAMTRAKKGLFVVRSPVVAKISEHCWWHRFDHR